MRDGRVKVEQSTGIAENNFLTFSNSKEGREKREQLLSSKRALSDTSSIASSVSKIQKPRSSNYFPPPRVKQNKPTTNPVCRGANVPDDLLLSTALLYYDFSKTLQTCYRTMSTRTEISNFLALCMSNRCSKSKTLEAAARNAKEYYDFAQNRENVIPFVGDDGVVCLAEWFISLQSRGVTVPRKARYLLKVFGEALGIDFPLNHPGVSAATRMKRFKAVKHAPAVPIDFVRKVEEYAASENQTWGVRLACSLFCLLVLASLRYSDTVKVFNVWKSGSAICGCSIDPKSKDGKIIYWATPIVGITGLDWAGPLLKLWENIKPSQPTGYAPLFPVFTKDWEILKSKIATAGTTQALLKRIEVLLGFSLGLKIHSPRSWASTCANQLLYSREDREKLGRWAPGSLMPDLYDRAVCATELRLRDEILNKIREGWSPSLPFETPGKEKAGSEDAETSSASSTSETSSVISEENIADLSQCVIDFDGSKGYV